MSHFLQIADTSRYGHISNFDLNSSKLYLANMQKHVSVTLTPNGNILIGIFTDDGKHYTLELLRLILIALESKHKNRIYEKVDYLLERSNSRKWYQFWRHTTYSNALSDAKSDASWISGSDSGYMDEVHYFNMREAFTKFKDHIEMTLLLEYDSSIKYTLKQRRFQEFLHFLNPNSILKEGCL